VEDYTPFNLKFDSELHKLGKSNQVTSSYERVTGKQVETFRIGKTVVFAEEIGIHAIKPFRTNIIYSDPRSVFPQRTKVVSNESTIKVKPLPKNAPNSFINGVGNFSVSAKLLSDHLTQGDVLTLHVEVKGQGNLHNTKTPKLTIPDKLSLYGDVEQQE